MNTLRATLVGLSVGFTAALVASCGQPASSCTPTNCAGCCDASGECQLGNLEVACGANGATCQACAADQVCRASLCVPRGDNGHGEDGGPNGTDGGVDGGSDAGNNDGPLVLGSRVFHYFHRDGTEEQVPEDFTAHPITAWTLQGETFKPVTVAYTGNGGFTLDVPRGTHYYVQIGRTTLVTDARTLDLGQNYNGRPSAALDGGSVSFEVTASGLNPWDDSSRIVLRSLDTTETGSLAPTQAITAGATSLSAEPFDYSSYWGNSLDAAKGDQAVLTQDQDFGDTDAGIFWTTNTRYAEPQPITVASNHTTVLTATFKPSPKKTFVLQLPAGTWDAIKTEANPGADFGYPTFTIYPVAGGFSRGWVGYIGELLTADLSGAVGDFSWTFSYGAPRSDWDELGDFNFYSYSPVSALGKSRHEAALFERMDVLSALAGKQLTPQMHPPVNLQVDGQNAQQPLTLASTTPRLSWSPPTSGNPTVYSLRIREEYLDQQGKLRGRNIAYLRTRETSIRIPPGVLKSGTPYIFLVGASEISGGPYDAASAPFYDYTHLNFAEVMSDVLTAP